MFILCVCQVFARIFSFLWIRYCDGVVEGKWWEWRLDSIREFGKEDPVKKAGHLSMSMQEADDDSSGIT